MGRDRSRSSSKSDSEDYRRRDDSRKRRDRDRHRDSDRERKRRSRSRSSSRHRRSTGSQRRRGSSRDGRHAPEYKDTSLLLRPTLSSHFSQPVIDQQDFDNWVHILLKCEQADDVEFAREKYSQFLKKYPYCYGFWTKFAEYEKRNGSTTKSKEVWERGIISISLSIDLWLGYIAQMKMVEDFPSEKIRELYERALQIAGLEFQSDRLWLDAIGFERSEYIHEMCSGNKNATCRRIGNLFDRLLSTPTVHASTHMERYIAYINTIEPNLLLDQKEYDEILSIVKEELDIDEVTHEVEQTYNVKSVGPKKQLTIVTTPDEESFSVTISRIEHEPNVLRMMREIIVERRKKIFEKNIQQCEMRAEFEANIKRPYFHVKPLDNSQLFNWMRYLDFEISQGDEERIRVLFERCLIACALYEEFWIKYARWAWRAKLSKSTIREIYERSRVHIYSSLNLTLSFCGFEESVQNFDDAIEILDHFRRTFPGYVLLEIRYLGLLRRKAEKENGSNYDNVIEHFEGLIKQSAKWPNLMSFYSLKLARFHQKVRNDPKLAQKVLKKAITTDPKNLKLYTQLIDIAYTSAGMNEFDILQAFDIVFESELMIEDKIRFSQRKLDLLEELGTDIIIIEDHRDFHFQLLGQLPDNSSIRTRFLNEPSRIQATQPLPPQQPPSMINWHSQMAPQPMGIMSPLIMQQQQPPAAYIAPIQQPTVQLKIIEPIPINQQPSSIIGGAGDGSGTPME